MPQDPHFSTFNVPQASIEAQVKSLQEQIGSLQKKKHLYSWQQAEGIITDQDLLSAHKQLKSEESVLNEQLARLESFKVEPSPPDMATFKKLAEYWSGDIAHELWNATDEMKAKFA